MEMNAYIGGIFDVSEMDYISLYAGSLQTGDKVLDVV
jgi:hypothetical protein